MESFDFSIPRFKELPKVPLYKEQVITYLEELAKTLNIESDEKLLTPTMLNNYVKQKVILPPKDKKYNEEHLAHLYRCLHGHRLRSSKAQEQPSCNRLPVPSQVHHPQKELPQPYLQNNSQIRRLSAYPASSGILR